jgi:hypothetical protein
MRVRLEDNVEFVHKMSNFYYCMEGKRERKCSYPKIRRGWKGDVRVRHIDCVS